MISVEATRSSLNEFPVPIKDADFVKNWRSADIVCPFRSFLFEALPCPFRISLAGNQAPSSVLWAGLRWRMDCVSRRAAC